jgi:DNA adenine methylase Dam
VQSERRKMMQSPLNYTGGKFKLLPQILPFFPKDINKFFDFFCGGCNVGINVDCQEVVCIDREENLICLYQTFQNLEKTAIIDWIYEIISKYGLSLVSQNGYRFYDCNSSAGLGTYNRESFNRLREDFNKSEIFDYHYYVMLYVIIVYAFNNQIRFNSSGKFNLPVGKRDFNANMHSKLLDFIDRVQSRNYRFICSDFRNFDITTISEKDFVYADPPYLITCATYNENGGWSDKDEIDLINFLDNLHANGIKFALSNVLRSKGKENLILLEWLKKNSDEYKAVHLKCSYANSNYHKTDKISNSDEVLIINYDI